MRCIIPAAGRGTRLRPHTHTKPKVLLSLGNKPIISHILDRVVEAKITDIIIIVGYEKNQIIDYVTANYENSCNLTFIEQKERKGLGHAIYLAGEYLDGEPVLIALGDSLYENSFFQMLDEFNRYQDWAGAITIKSVSNPQAYGIVNTYKNSNQIKNLEEKPKNPTSSKAITGVYIIRDSVSLKESLEELVAKNQIGTGGEIQLTDALQIMVNNRNILGTIDSGRWFDCGKKEALLAAHKYVLNKMSKSVIASDFDNSIMIYPVAIQPDCEISNSVIGPYVSIDKGTIIERSIISSSIIGTKSHVKNASINDSLVGDRVELVGGLSDLDIGDHSSIKYP
jgi:glucose-1-phosphate thymidylyltransferase